MLYEEQRRGCDRNQGFKIDLKAENKKKESER